MLHGHYWDNMGLRGRQWDKMPGEASMKPFQYIYSGVLKYSNRARVRL